MTEPLEITHGIVVTSYIGSMDGEHYYGKAWRKEDDGRSCRSTDDDPYYWEFDVMRMLTSPKEVARLNKKDAPYSYIKVGDETYRFNNKEDVIKHGIELLVEKYGGDITIVKGNMFNISDGPQPVIYGVDGADHQPINRSVP